MPACVREQIGIAYGCGAHKYSRDNFRRGYKWSLSIDAMERHWAQWLGGESWHTDPSFPPGAQVHHLASAIWHLCCLLFFELMGRGEDDRGVTFDKKIDEENKKKINTRPV